MFFWLIVHRHNGPCAATREGCGRFSVSWLWESPPWLACFLGSCGSYYVSLWLLDCQFQLSRDQFHTALSEDCSPYHVRVPTLPRPCCLIPRFTDNSIFRLFPVPVTQLFHSAHPGELLWVGIFSIRPMCQHGFSVDFI